MRLPRVRFWCAALCCAALVGCGGGGKKSSKVSTSSTKSGKSKKPKKPKKPSKPPTPRSKSGKTVDELVLSIADSYKGLDPSMDVQELLDAEEKRLKITAELVEMGKAALPKVLAAATAPSLQVEVREWACAVLGEIGEGEAAEPLLKIALSNDRNMGIHACDALGRLHGVAGALAKLKPLLKTRPWQAGHPMSEAQAGLLRNASAEAIARGGDKDGVPALIDGMEHASAEVRRDAMVRLRRLSGKEIPATVDGSIEARKANVRRWRAWWKESGGVFRPDPHEGRANHAVFVGQK